MNVPRLLSQLFVLAALYGKVVCTALASTAPPAGTTTERVLSPSASSAPHRPQAPGKKLRAPNANHKNAPGEHAAEAQLHDETIITPADLAFIKAMEELEEIEGAALNDLKAFDVEDKFQLRSTKPVYSVSRLAEAQRKVDDAVHKLMSTWQKAGGATKPASANVYINQAVRKAKTNVLEETKTPNTANKETSTLPSTKNPNFAQLIRNHVNQGYKSAQSKVIDNVSVQPGETMSHSTERTSLAQNKNEEPADTLKDAEHAVSVTTDDYATEKLKLESAGSFEEKQRLSRVADIERKLEEAGVRILARSDKERGEAKAKYTASDVKPGANADSSQWLANSEGTVLTVYTLSAATVSGAAINDAATGASSGQLSSAMPKKAQTCLTNLKSSHVASQAEATETRKRLAAQWGQTNTGSTGQGGGTSSEATAAQGASEEAQRNAEETVTTLQEAVDASEATTTEITTEKIQESGEEAAAAALAVAEVEQKLGEAGVRISDEDAKNRVATRADAAEESTTMCGGLACLWQCLSRIEKDEYEDYTNEELKTMIALKEEQKKEAESWKRAEEELINGLEARKALKDDVARAEKAAGEAASTLGQNVIGTSEGQKKVLAARKQYCDHVKKLEKLVGAVESFRTQLMKKEPEEDAKKGRCLNWFNWKKTKTTNEGPIAVAEEAIQQAEALAKAAGKELENMNKAYGKGPARK